MEKETKQTKKPELKIKNPVVLAVVGVIAVVCVIVFIFTKNDKTTRDIFYAMDTTVTVKLWGDKNSGYRELVKELSELLDCYDSDSEIYRLNQNKSVKLSSYTKEVLLKSRELCEDYPQCDITAGELIDLWNINGGGYLPTESEIEAALSGIDIENLTISDKKAKISGGKINLGSVAKGYACDVLKKEFEKNDEKCAIVSFGSSSLMYGEKPDGEKFTVGVNNPLDKDKTLGTLELSECFVSTSGGYERYFEKDGVTYSHIFDLKTGYPAQTDLLSVTVIGESGLLTDFLSTCIYINGTAGLEEFFDNDEIQLVAVDENKNIYISSELEGDFSLDNKDFTVIYK